MGSPSRAEGWGGGTETHWQTRACGGAGRGTATHHQSGRLKNHRVDGLVRLGEHKIRIHVFRLCHAQHTIAVAGAIAIPACEERTRRGGGDQRNGIAYVKFGNTVGIAWRESLRMAGDRAAARAGYDDI
ncbi:hypothetical protein CCP4SC76_3350004 [Gammaproteobacteria bacterium]